MKKLYLFCLLTFLIAGCSKDFLKRYDKRIIGTWELTDVDNNGQLGSTQGLPFRDGLFVFSESGELTYTEPGTGAVYKGSWDLNRVNERGGEVYRILSIHAIDFTNEDVKSELFEDMQFTGTNRFKAFIYAGFNRYVFRFHRR